MTSGARSPEGGGKGSEIYARRSYVLIRKKFYLSLGLGEYERDFTAR